MGGVTDLAPRARHTCHKTWADVTCACLSLQALTLDLVKSRGARCRVVHSSFYKCCCTNPTRPLPGTAYPPSNPSILTNPKTSHRLPVCDDVAHANRPGCHVLWCSEGRQKTVGAGVWPEPAGRELVLGCARKDLHLLQHAGQPSAAHQQSRSVAMVSGRPQPTTLAQ